MKEKAKKALIENIKAFKDDEFNKENGVEFKSCYAWAYLSGYAPDLSIKDGYQIMNELHDAGLVTL